MVPAESNFMLLDIIATEAIHAEAKGMQLYDMQEEADTDFTNIRK